MKRKIILIILLLLSSGKIFSDDDCTDCRNKYNGSEGYQFQIGYNFCDPINHKIVSLCTNGDPYNLPQPYTGWQPMKLCLPLSYGSTVTYSNTDEPWENKGPWTETSFGQTNVSLEFRDSDIPSLIEAALDYWQDICSSYNTDDCQQCSIKILWSKDASKLGDDKALPSHANNPLTPGECSYDCSKLAIILNGTSGFSSVDSKGKPTKYFFTRGGGVSSDYDYGYFVNADLRLEIMHQLGTLLGFSGTTPNGDPGCGSPWSTMSESDKSGKGRTYWEIQANRISALSSSCNFNPSYNFTHNTFQDYDQCAFRLLYCCEPLTGIKEDINGPDILFEIKPNPVSSELNIIFKIIQPQVIDLAIYNLLGDRLISIIKYKYLEQNVYNYDVELNQLASGTYYCIYRKGDEIISKMFVLLR